ncbi:hypothetical protein OUZ56_021274 [Daphnia magna]|uniref:Uncharacterized protein n=1 Tax=Daphnia magna TaxID=35525 RepID=A0ABQ9ZHY5_9CRUS|nr:hypothetical protein OUZ56_021274 [Daphnia magna]
MCPVSKLRDNFCTGLSFAFSIFSGFLESEMGELLKSGFKGGSPIRPHVKIDYSATHPARVADFDDSSFRPIYALSSTRRYHVPIPCQHHSKRNLK